MSVGGAQTRAKCSVLGVEIAVTWDARVTGARISVGAGCARATPFLVRHAADRARARLCGMDPYIVCEEEFLSDERLCALAGCDSLASVRYLEMTVDTSEHTLSDLGQRLPALGQLKLSHSNIATLRDLGTGLGSLLLTLLLCARIHWF